MKCKACGKAIIHEEVVCGSCVSDINREVFEGGWTQVEEGAGSANRTDRLRLCGNGVVPATAAKAFRTLLGRFENHEQPTALTKR